MDIYMHDDERLKFLVEMEEHLLLEHPAPRTRLGTAFLWALADQLQVEATELRRRRRNCGTIREFLRCTCRPSEEIKYGVMVAVCADCGGAFAV